MRYPKLIDGFLAQSELCYSELVQSLEFHNTMRLHADVAWLASNQWKLLSQFTSETRFGKDSAMVFLPKKTARSAEMGEHCYRLSVELVKLSLHMCGSVKPFMPSDAISLAILRLTVNIGGIPYQNML